LTFAWYFFTCAFLIHYSTLINASPLSNFICSCKTSHYRDQSKIINSCLICHLPNMLAFSWYLISHNTEVILLIPFALFLLLELDCFHDLPIQQHTTLAFIQTICGISSSLPSCWTYIHLSFHNPQVYAINSISCSTLSKLVRPLIMLSFNSPKPTKGLDALTRFHQKAVLDLLSIGETIVGALLLVLSMVPAWSWTSCLSPAPWSRLVLWM
jgi:hypothetical protein